MVSTSPLSAGPLRAVFDLFDVGVSLMRQNLRRGDPEASDAEIDRRLGAWLRHRPGAEAGDCTGRPVDPAGRIE